MAKGQDDLFERYVDGPPCAQNAVDAVPGWITAFPPQYGVRAGSMGLGADTRIDWAIRSLGGVKGARVLELGPLDGGHTAMLHAAGAARIDAVEANRLAFLRCLVTKEIMGLDRARFHLGDFTRGLDGVGKRWDLVVACGVLYHLQEPGALLETLAGVTDAIYLWTHVFDPETMPPGDPRRGALTGAVARRTVAGAALELHARRYLGADRSVSFCGGPRDQHVWMDRAGLIATLRALGFTDLAVAHDDPRAQAGPALSILARRPGAAAAP